MAQLKIAVIDDASMIRDLIKKFVKQNFPDARIFEANNGKNAIVMLTRQPIDLILCDWEMPEVDGEEVLRWVREKDHLKNKPFIMVTSRGDKEFVVKAIESGVSDYLVKPFNNKQFLEKIYKACRRHGIKLPDSALLNKPPTGRGGDSLAVLTGRGTAAPATKSKSSRPMQKGAALVRTANGDIRCALKQLDLKSMVGVFKQSEFMPTLLEQVSMDLEFKQEEEKKVVRINGFIQMLRSNEERPDSELILIKVFFMDEDPEKLELLSQYVGQFR